MNKMFISLAAIGIMALFIAPAFGSLIGDVNDDGKVDLRDLVLVVKAFHSHPGMPNWDVRCDLDGNGVVNLADLVIVASHYGEHTS